MQFTKLRNIINHKQLTIIFFALVVAKYRGKNGFTTFSINKSLFRMVSQIDDGDGNAPVYIALNINLKDVSKIAKTTGVDLSVSSENHNAFILFNCHENFLG